MTPKRDLFVVEYLKDLNASAAAERAGYSWHTAGKIGHELLKIPEIAAAIQCAMDERAEREKITADRVLREAAAVALFDPRKLFNPDGTMKPLNELDDATAAAIAGIEVVEIADGDGQPIGRVKKVRLADKLGALTLLARHLGMLNDKLTLRGDAENPLTLLVKAIQGSTVQPVPTAALPKPGDGD
ncbi:terminase small subunit [Xanthobacter sediminis]